MNPRVKKLIGAVVMVVFIAVYVMLIVALAPPILKDASKLTELAFYAIAGLAWALPLLPIIKWMEQKPK